MIRSLTLLTLLALTGKSAFGAGMHEVTSSAGIVSPSALNALLENGAGLVYNDHVLVQGWGATPGTDVTSNLNFGVRAAFGNSKFGAAVGADWYRTSYDTTAFGGTVTSDTTVTFRYGAGLLLGEKWALGANGTYTSGTATVNPGLIYNPKGKFHLGAMTASSFKTYGLGLSYDYSDATSFVLDSSATSLLNGVAIRPAVEFRAGDAMQLSFSYGWLSQNVGTSLIQSGVEFGFNKALSSSIHLQGYYNQYNTYFLGFSIKI